MTHSFFQVTLRLAPWRGLGRTILALAFIGLSSISMAEDAVKLSPEQATSLGVRVVHPIASPTDKTLPYPAQIVIPTPQLWVVSSPVAGMVTGLSVARGRPGQRWPAARRHGEFELRVAATRLPAGSCAGSTDRPAAHPQHPAVPEQRGAATCSGGQPDRSPAGKHRGCGAAANASAQRPFR